MRPQQWKALYALASAAGRCLETEEVMRVGLEQALGALGAETGSMHLRGESGELVMAFSHGLSSEAVPEMERFVAGQGLTGQVAKAGQPVVAGPARVHRASGRLGEEGFGAVLALPIKADNEVLGVLGVVFRHTRRPKDGALLEAVGNTLGQAVKNALLHQRMKQAAFTDAVTGLPNARYIREEIQKQIARARRGEGSFSLAMVDLDNLKSVNDRFGHGAGDRLLRDIASLLRSTVRASDIVGRFGGDEFLLLLPGADSAGASRTVERISAQVANYRLNAEGAAFPVRVSVGLVSYPEDGCSAEELLGQADEAMYRNKKAINPHRQ